MDLSHQVIITNKLSYNQAKNDSTSATMDYFSHLFEYLSSTKSVVDHLTKSIEEFVAKELDMFQGRDSSIVKHYSKLKNPCFVTCVNSALCGWS
jgi:hypothetical protein